MEIIAAFVVGFLVRHFWTYLAAYALDAFHWAWTKVTGKNA